MQVKGLAGCLGHSRCLISVEARLMCAAPHSATPGGLQESKGYERQEGWVSAVLIPVWWGQGYKGKETPSPLQPEFPKYSFLAKYLMA